MTLLLLISMLRILHTKDIILIQQTLQFSSVPMIQLTRGCVKELAVGLAKNVHHKSCSPPSPPNPELSSVLLRSGIECW